MCFLLWGGLADPSALTDSCRTLEVQNGRTAMTYDDDGDSRNYDADY